MNRAPSLVWAISLISIFALSSCRFIRHHHTAPGVHGPACADIRAAAGASFSTDAASGLIKIAAREGMTAHEQVHLIDATFESVSFSSDRAKVLTVLAANKTLDPLARKDLSYRISSIGFSSDQKRVADALINNPDRGDRPAERKDL